MSDATPDLDDFLKTYQRDDNEWWQIDCGDHQNLFEAAVDRMCDAEQKLKLASRMIDELKEKSAVLHQTLREVVIDLELVEEEDVP